TNNGAINGTITAVAGEIDGAANLNGSSYVGVGNSASLTVSSSVTVSAWINTTASGRQDTIDKYATSPYAGYGLVLGSSSAGSVNFWNGANYLNYSAGINDGNWHYVVGVYDGTTSYIYVD